MTDKKKPTIEELEQMLNRGEKVELLPDGSVREKERRVLLIGLPKSGKSTLIRRHFIPGGYAVVCPDDVRLALHGQRFIAKAEPFVWATIHVMVEALLFSGNKVVIDGTFTTRKRRQPWEDLNPTFCWIKTNEEVCLERAREENDQEIIPVIQRQAAQFEEPDEYFIVE